MGTSRRCDCDAGWFAARLFRRRYAGYFPHPLLGGAVDCRRNKELSMKTLSRVLAISGVGAVSLGAILFAQVNSVQPQPQADKLAAVSVPTRGNSARGTKPDA